MVGWEWADPRPTTHITTAIYYYYILHTTTIYCYTTMNIQVHAEYTSGGQYVGSTNEPTQLLWDSLNSIVLQDVQW